MIWHILWGALGGILGTVAMTWWLERRRRRRWFNHGPLELPHRTRGKKGRSMKAVIWGVIAVLIGAGVAAAWDFGPNDPGRPRFPTTIRPQGNGWTIQRPGQFPTTVRPMGNGWTIQEPGQFPRTCRPMGNSIVCN